MLKQAKNVRLEPVTYPLTAGEVHTRVFKHTFTEDVAATDILEMGGLPARCQVVGVRMESANVGAINLKVGFLSDRYGEKDDARSLSADFYAAQDAATADTLGLAACAGIAKGDEHRGIGIQPAAVIAAGATKVIYIEVSYVA